MSTNKDTVRALAFNRFISSIQPNAPKGDLKLYSPVEKTVLPAAAKPGVVLYSKEFYALCGIGGILSCGITHALMTPLDLVKCNAQANPKEFTGTIQGFKKIFSGEAASLGHRPGWAGLVKGWGPTAWGYSLQGLCKFGFYEFFKHEYSMVVGEERAYKYRDLVYLFASASAEVIADVALCPFEAVKVRIQTNPHYAKGLLDGLPKMYASEGLGSLYAGITPLWARQVPYTIIKFMAFERIAEAIYKMIPKPKSEMTKTEQMGVVFTAGYIAGVLCGIVSHPADTMVSKINKLKMDGGIVTKMKVIYNGTPSTPGIGFAGLWAGFAPRVVMIGTLTGLQWFIYGAFKAYVGLPTPGAVAPGQEKKH
jgi:solute carrier family 25 phosphate transporter 3